MALTDHRVYNYTNFAPDAGVTLIPGMEMDLSLIHISFDKGVPWGKWSGVSGACDFCAAYNLAYF